MRASLVLLSLTFGGGLPAHGPVPLPLGLELGLGDGLGGLLRARHRLRLLLHEAAAGLGAAEGHAEVVRLGGGLHHSAPSPALQASVH